VAGFARRLLRCPGLSARGARKREVNGMCAREGWLERRTEHRKLPPEPSQLPYTLQVVFVGPKKPSPTDALLCSRVGVKRALLHECLNLLLTSPQYAPVFGGGEMPCSLDEKALAKYPENGVPESIMSTLIHTQNLAADRRDSAGHTARTAR